ncbi:hypothetical protein, partial [Pseudomonas sp. PDM13]|uniref:hypothetical protein n=1 Tax=Pseudomonas sp. PDM13 TaxID=2769255 RepID=UPI0021E04FE6
LDHHTATTGLVASADEIAGCHIDSLSVVVPLNQGAKCTSGSERRRQPSNPGGQDAVASKVRNAEIEKKSEMSERERAVSANAG